MSSRKAAVAKATRPAAKAVVAKTAAAKPVAVKPTAAKPVADRNSVSPTEIMTTTSSLLKAANLAVFELGMWQSWTGR